MTPRPTRAAIMSHPLLIPAAHGPSLLWVDMFEDTHQNAVVLHISLGVVNIVR